MENLTCCILKQPSMGGLVVLPKPPSGVRPWGPRKAGRAFGWGSDEGGARSGILKNLWKHRRAGDTNGRMVASCWSFFFLRPKTTSTLIGRGVPVITPHRMDYSSYTLVISPLNMHWLYFRIYYIPSWKTQYSHQHIYHIYIHPVSIHH